MKDLPLGRGLSESGEMMLAGDRHRCMLVHENERVKEGVKF